MRQISRSLQRRIRYPSRNRRNAITPKGRRRMGGPRAEFHDIPTGIDAIDQTIEHEPLDALTLRHTRHALPSRLCLCSQRPLRPENPSRTLARIPHRLGKTPATPAPGMATLRPHPGLGLSDRQRPRLRPGPRIVRRTQQNEQTHPRPTRHRTRILSL